MNTQPILAATVGAMLLSTGTLLAQSAATPDSTQPPARSSVVIRQSGTGNSATVTQTSGDGKTTVVTSTNGGNTLVVRHDGNSTVHIDQSGATEPQRNRPKPEPDKRKPD